MSKVEYFIGHKFLADDAVDEYNNIYSSIGIS